MSRQTDQKRKSTRINFSIPPEDIKEMDGIFAELKKRLLPMSGTVRKLFKQFRDDGYKFKDQQGSDYERKRLPVDN